MSRLVTGCLATLALLATPVDARAADVPKQPDMAIDVPEYNLTTKVFDLPTGLRVMFQEDRSHPIVSIMSIVDHGSSDDPVGKEGLAHFVEHTWFRSVHEVKVPGDVPGETKTITLPPIMDMLQDYGTVFNATTRSDWTDYRTVVSAEYLDIFLQLESMRLTEPYKGVTEDQIATEVEVITNEWRRRNEQSISLLFDYLRATVYPEGHPYHRRSTKESLASIRLADLQGFFDEHYKPENTTIMVVGDFDINEASSLLFKNFAPEMLHPELTEEHLFFYPKPGVTEPDQANPDHWLTGAYDPVAFKNGEKVPFEFVDVSEREPRITEERPEIMEPTEKELVKKKAPIDHRTVLVGWPLPAGFRSDNLSLQMLSNLATNQLYQHFNSTNYRIYAEDWRPSDIGSRFCTTQAEKEGSMLMCMVEVKNRKLDPENIADKIIDQMNGIYDAQLLGDPNYRRMLENGLHTAKMDFLTDTLKSVDLVAYHFGGRAEDIVTQAHYTGDPRSHSANMNEVMNMEYANIAALAPEYLKRDRAVKLVVDPLRRSELDTSGEGSTYAGASEDDAVVEDGKDVLDYTPEEIADAYLAPDLSDLVDTTLDNGMRVVVLPHGEAPLVYAKLITGGGNRSTAYPKNLSQFADIFDTFEPTFDEERRQQALSVAGNWSSATWSSVRWMGIRGSAGNLDGILWMLRDEVEQRAPDLNGKGMFLNNQLDGMKIQWSNAGFHSRKAFLEHTYPGDPTRQSDTWEEIEALSDWGASDVNQVLADYLQPANATLVIVGNVDADEAVEEAKAQFGSWKARPGATTDLEPLRDLHTAEMPTGSKVLVYDKPENTQTQVSGYCRLNYEGKPDDAAISVLGSYIGNATMKILRVKEGLAYSPGASASPSIDGTAMLYFSSLAVNDGVGRTVEVMKKLMTDAEAGNFDEREIALHKLRRARGSGVEAQSTLQMMDKLETPIVYGYSFDELLKTGEYIAEVDSDQLERIAEGCESRSIFTLTGPAEVITPQLEEKGFTYEVVDWEAEGNALLQEYAPKDYKKKMKRQAKEEKAKAKEEGEG